jgi:hypothetical protein
MKPEIKYGLMAALLLVMWTLIQYALKFHTHYFSYNSYTIYGVMLVLFITLLASLREKRIDYAGHLGVRNGIRSGLFQLFITASLASGFMMVYNYRINSLWVENLVKWEHEHGGRGIFIRIANDASATPDTVILSNTELHLCYYFLSILFIGGVFSFIISGLLGDKNIPREVPEETVRATLRHMNT